MKASNTRPMAPMFLIGLLALLSFWIVQQIHLPASFGVKGLNAINVLMLLAVLAVFMIRRDEPRSPPPPMRVPIIIFFMALLWGFVMGQLVDNSMMNDDLTILKTGVFYISMYFLFYYGVRSVSEIRLLVLVILVVATLASLEAIREAFDYGFAVYSDSKRAAGPFGADYRASNLAAVFFAIFIPLFVSVAFFLSDRPIVRFAALGGAALLICALFFTYSRQAYAIVVIVAMLMAFRKNLLVALLLSVALWNYELWVPSSAVDRVQMTEQVDEYGQATVDDSTSSRWELWEGAGLMLQDNPMGIGLNHFKREVHKYTQYTNLDAHNFYVLITAEAGIFGGVAIVILVVSMLRFAVGNLAHAHTPEAKTLAYGFLGATIALLMGNMYGSRMLNGEVIGNYWVLAALAARYFALQREGRLTSVQGEVVQHDRVGRKTRSAAGRRLPVPAMAVDIAPDPVASSMGMGGKRDQFGRRR